MSPEFIIKYELMAKAFGAQPNFHKTTLSETKIPREHEDFFVSLLNIPFNQERGAYIFGRPGVGKTHAMKIKFNQNFYELIEARLHNSVWSKTPFWINASQYLEGLKQFNESAERLRENAFNSSWLFIDDLGATTKTDWAVDQVYQLLDYRLQTQKQTFITSNLSIGEIGNFYNERISSRIAELCLPFYLDGKDERIEGMKAAYTDFKKQDSRQQ